MHSRGPLTSIGTIWLSLSIKGTWIDFRPSLINLEFLLILSLSVSDSLLSSMLLIDAAAIDGFIEDVKIKPEAKKM